MRYAEGSRCKIIAHGAGIFENLKIENFEKFRGWGGRGGSAPAGLLIVSSLSFILNPIPFHPCRAFPTMLDRSDE